MEESKINGIIEDYSNGMSLKDIKNKYRTSTDTIYKLIDKNGIARKTYKNLDKFYDLKNPEVQYWLGYICADGNIQYSLKHRVYKVSLFSKDEEVLLEFKKCFGDIVRLHYRPTGIIEGYINSKKLCEYFINTLNITPNKSLTLDPKIEFTKNFILGYFDGDGSVMTSSETRTRYESKITGGSEIFINKVAQILKAEGIYYIIRSKGNAFDISIERKEESKKFYKWLYTDKVWCLPRKLNTFVALFGNLEKNNRENCGELDGQSAAELSE